MNIHDTRHKENSKYAHYSRINKHNFKNYNLKNTHPKKFTLEKGECLFIPRGWWHWIVSKPNTKAYNIWFKNDKIKQNKPFVLSEKINCCINNNSLIQILKNTKIIVYNENINDEYEMTISEYITLNIKNSYVITLNDVYSQNRIIIDKIIKYLPIPLFLNDIPITKDNVNFWFNINEMDTGMHFDDDDGILCIIDGIKEILLFPPEDSLLLDGYIYQIYWINNKIEDLLYNTYTLRNNCLINSHNKLHNNILLLFSIQNLEIIRYINNLCGIFGQNNIIYGVKCDLDGNIRYEYYFYTYSKYDKSYVDNHSLNNVNKQLSKELFNSIKKISLDNIKTENLIIHSFDLYNINNTVLFNKPNESPKISLYYNLHPNNSFERPFYGKLYEYDGLKYSDEYLFILTDTNYIVNNVSIVLNNIHLKIKPEIIISLISKYKYVPDICIYNKGKNNNKLLFCIQYFGLSNQDFYDFLIKYKYPETLINFYYKNNNKFDYVNKEITIHFELDENMNENIRVLRTAFYGCL